MGVLHRVLKQTGGDKAGGMRHIDHEDSTDLVGKTTHAGVIPFTGVGAGTADNEAGTLAACEFLHLLVVDTTCCRIHIVAQGVEHQAGEVHGASVREVAAVVEVHTHEFVAGIEHRHEHRHVGLRSRMGLHIGVFCTEKLFKTVLGEGLGLINNLAAAIVTVAGIAFGIFVGQA